MYSVVIPCRNDHDVINCCVESLLNQTIKPSKIFIVNDGSNEDTFLKLMEVEKKDQSIKIIHLYKKRLKRSGENIARAIKEGLTFINEKYVLLLDSDTEIPLDYSEKCLKEMEAFTKIGICGGWFSQHDRLRSHVPGCARMVKKNLLEDYPIMWGHDTYLQMRIEKEGYKSKVIDCYINTRPVRKLTLKRLYYRGEFRSRIGHPLLYSLKSFQSQAKKKPYLIGSLIVLFSHFINNFRNWDNV